MYLETLKSAEFIEESNAWEIKLSPVTLIIGHPKYGGDETVEYLSDSIYTGDCKNIMDHIILYDDPLPEQNYDQLYKYFHSVYGLIIAQNIGSTCHYSQLQPLWDAIIKSIITTDSQIIATTQNLEVVHSFIKALQKHKEFDLGKIAKIKPGSPNNVINYKLHELEKILNNNWDIR